MQAGIDDERWSAAVVSATVTPPQPALQQEVDWTTLDDGNEALLVNGGGIDGGSSSTARDTAWAMTEGNVELVRRSWNAWRRGDLDGMFADYWDREIAWDMAHFREWPDRSYQGTEGVRRFLSEWLEVWTDYEAGVDDILVAPDGRVVTLAWQRGRGRESGLAMDMEWAQIATIERGEDHPG